jgi:hypothetical protein
LNFLFLVSEAHQSNAHLSRLIRAYRSPLQSKTTQSPTTAPALLPSPTKRTRRMSPSNRSKSPPKVAARQSDPSPKRPVINETINTERLKLARDEAERAMKVKRRRKRTNHLIVTLFRITKYSLSLGLILHFENRYDGDLNFFNFSSKYN